MRDNNANKIDELCGVFEELRLPRWRELPDLELYMDQVLSLVSRYLGGYPGFQGKGLTAAMVNNYVKQGVLPPPFRKKYDRSHVARLFMICILKASLPIPAIRELIDRERETAPEDEIYDRFCGQFERTNRDAVSAMRSLSDGSEPDAGPLSAVYRSALRAQAEQAISLGLFAALFPEGESSK